MNVKLISNFKILHEIMPNTTPIQTSKTPKVRLFCSKINQHSRSLKNCVQNLSIEASTSHKEA